MRLVCVWSLVCSLIGSFIALSVRSFVRSLVCFFLSVRLLMLVKCFFGLVLLVRGLFHVFGRFVGWFWFEKICSTSPPRGNQVDGLPRASSFEYFWASKH